MEDIKTKLLRQDNEFTRCPYWLIIDPSHQNMTLSVDILASQITGPFFSREDAENYLKSRRYNFSKRAVVYCCSGHASRDYENLFKV